MRIRRISSGEPNKCPGMDQQKAKTGGGARIYSEEANPSGREGGGSGRGGGNILNVSFLFSSISILSMCMIHSLGC